MGAGGTGYKEGKSWSKEAKKSIFENWGLNIANPPNFGRWFDISNLKNDLKNFIKNPFSFII